MISDYAIDRINRTAGVVIKAFLRNGKDKMKRVKEDMSRKESTIGNGIFCKFIFTCSTFNANTYCQHAATRIVDPR